jgi:hypothetical protein
VPTKIVLKVDFLERDFERDHLAEKATGQKWAKKYIVHCLVSAILAHPQCSLRGRVADSNTYPGASRGEIKMNPHFTLNKTKNRHCCIKVSII